MIRFLKLKYHFWEVKISGFKRQKATLKFSPKTRQVSFTVLVC